MSSNFKSTKKNFPCPICGDSSGKCRISTDDLILCMTYVDEECGDGTHKYIKTSKDGLWGVHVVSERSYSNSTIFRRELNRKKRKKKKDREEDKQRTKALNVDSFDRIFNHISETNPLESRHLEDLSRRGLGDKVLDSIPFFSLTNGQPTECNVPWNFPGVSQNRFKVGPQEEGDWEGYAVPAFNKDGQVQGYQIRLDSRFDAKYLWPRTQLTSKIVIDNELELPLSYVDIRKTGNKTTLLTEGILKPILTSHRTGYATIGASGGHFGASPLQLKEMLKGCEEVWYCPDAGDVINPHVYKRIIRTLNTLAKIKMKVKILWWGQVSKEGGKDVDEIDQKTFESAELLSVSDFFALCKKEQDNHLLQKEQEALRGLSYKPTVFLDERYLPNLIDLIPDLKGLVGIKSPKGSGKSYQIDKLCHEAKSRGMKILSLTARIALGREQALKWHGEWFGDVRGRPSVFNIDNFNHLGITLDSCYKVQCQDWSKVVVIIDEAELAQCHALLGSTCKEKRPKILAAIQLIVKETLDKGGCALIADADLTDTSIKYFRSLASSKVDFNLIVNKGSEVPKWDITYYEGGSKDVIIEQVFQQLQSTTQEGDAVRQKRVAVACDSQKDAEALERAAKEKDPTIRVVRIDRKITETEAGKEFMAAPNQGILDSKPVLFIFSPSMGAGVSIDVNWFDMMFGIFNGTIVPSQARQMLGRIREEIPRVVWCAKRGLNSDNSGPTQNMYRAMEVKEALFNDAQQVAIILDIARTIAEEDGSDKTHFMESLTGLWNDGDPQWDNNHLSAYCNVLVRNNYDKRYLSATLVRELKEEGHRVTVVGKGNRNEDGDRVRNIKKIIPVEEAARVVDAITITFEQAQILESQLTTTEEERYQIAKAYLINELPGVELTVEFVHKALTADNRRWLNSHKLWWYSQNPKETEEKDKGVWKAFLKNIKEGVAFIPDIKTISLQLEALNEIGLIEFIQRFHREEVSFTNQSPELLEILSKARRSKRFKDAFSMRVTKRSQTVRTINQLLEKVGFKLTFKKEGKGKVREYHFDRKSLEDPDRIKVLKALDCKKEQREEARKLREENKAMERVFGYQKNSSKPSQIKPIPLPKHLKMLVSEMSKVTNIATELKQKIKQAATFLKSSTISKQEFWEQLPRTIQLALKQKCNIEMSSFLAEYG